MAPDIFISYARPDHALVRKLANALKAEGFRVWWDTALDPGETYDAKIEENLRNAALVLVLWSKKSVTSKWVRAEANLADELNTLVPARIENCNPPLPFNLNQTLDLRRWDSGKATDAWEKLIALARQRRAARPTHDAEPAGEASLESRYWDTIKHSVDPEDYQDYLERYPHGPHAVDAKAIQEPLRRRSAKGRLLWTLMGVALFSALLVPNLTLALDFSWDTAFALAKLYFHYFLFFLLAGPMLVIFYLWPLSKALGYVTGIRRAVGRVSGVALLLVVPGIVVAGATAVEISSGAAPWELNRAALEKPLPPLVKDQAQTLTLQRIFEAASNSAEVERLKALSDRRADELGERRNDPVIACLALLDAVPTSKCSAAKIALAREMQSLRADPANRSRTYYAYRASFPVFALLFLGSFVTIIVHGLTHSNVRAWMIRQNPKTGQALYVSNLFFLGAQMAFIGLWFVARIIYQIQTSTIFAVGDAGHGDGYAAIRLSYGLFLFVYLVAIACLLVAALRLREKRASQVVGALAGIVTGAISLAVNNELTRKAFSIFIGVDATIVSISILAIVLFLGALIPVLWPVIAPVEEDQED